MKRSQASRRSRKKRSATARPKTRQAKRNAPMRPLSELKDKVQRSPSKRGAALAKLKLPQRRTTIGRLNKVAKAQSTRVRLGSRQLAALRQLSALFGVRQLATCVGVHQSTLLRVVAGLSDQCTPSTRHAFQRFFAK